MTQTAVRKPTAPRTSETVLARVKKMPYGLKGFTLFCTLLRIEDGSQLKLYPAQKLMLTDLFAGMAVETVIVIPKGNGKTTLLAALGLYHLFKVHRAECLIGASSRDQATYIFQQATNMVEEAKLDDVFDVKGGYRHIRYEGGRIRVLAAEAGAQDGAIPTLALVDELHRHKTGDLYTVFRKGLAKRPGSRMVTISTAGATMASPLGEMRRRFYESPEFTRTGAYNYIRSPDGTAVFHEWCLLPEDDVTDYALVKTANPAPWHTPEGLRREHDSYSTTSWDWLRFSCGIWTEGEEPWLPPEEWDKLARPDMHLESGEPVWLGVDVGTKRDTTAIALVARRGDTLFAAPPRIFVPPKGGTLSLELVELAIREIGRDHPIMLIAYDPDQFGRSAEILGNEGYPMLKYAQSPEAMTVATATLYQLIVSSKLLHDGDQALRAHVMAGVSKPTERGFRLVKERRGGRMIDALIALEMACHEAAKAVSPPPLVVLPAEVF